MTATNRESPLNAGGGATNGESTVTLLMGRPVHPRAVRNSVLPLVARMTTSPSPTTGESVYAVQRPSGDSVAPEIVRHESYVSCVSGFLAGCAAAFAASKTRTERRPERIMAGYLVMLRKGGGG